MVGNRPRYNAIVLSCSIIDKQEIIEKYLLSCDLKSSIMLPRQGTIRQNQFLHRLFAFSSFCCVINIQLEILKYLAYSDLSGTQQFIVGNYHSNSWIYIELYAQAVALKHANSTAKKIFLLSPFRLNSVSLTLVLPLHAVRRIGMLCFRTPITCYHGVVVGDVKKNWH